MSLAAKLEEGYNRQCYDELKDVITSVQLWCASDISAAIVKYIDLLRSLCTEAKHPSSALNRYRTACLHHQKGTAYEYTRDILAPHCWQSTIKFLFAAGKPSFTGNVMRTKDLADVSAAQIGLAALAEDITSTIIHDLMQLFLKQRGKREAFWTSKGEPFRHLSASDLLQLAREATEEKSPSAAPKEATEEKSPSAAPKEATEEKSPSAAPKRAYDRAPTPEKVSDRPSGRECAVKDIEFKKLSSWLIAGQSVELEAEKKKHEQSLKSLQAQLAGQQETLNREREMHIRQKTKDELRYTDRVRGLRRKFDAEMEQASATQKAQRQRLLEQERQIEEHETVQKAQRQRLLEQERQLQQKEREVSRISKLVQRSGDKLCPVCWEHPATEVLVPCGHFGVCTICVPHLQSKCPICKAHFERHTHVFFAT
eukprot:TRINITY_DN4883_c0_g1_i1.p1 TRINITY_DN4883_c0_g1~~TRINITY_DN4883_c0_g1_i1.p1  ORF type:complete len:426 (+),score=90.75 TRINITY_DN4883_c0_g1_i1:61-1338(+)